MRASTRIIVAGGALETLAVLQQLQWHADHGGREPFGSLVAAHAPIYAGAALAALGAALAIARPQRLISRVAWGALLAAALVRFAAFALDARLHAAGADPTLAHDLYRDGAALAAAVAIVKVGVAAAWGRTRRERTLPDAA